MKITNEQLKQIIKEELEKVLQETSYSPTEIYMDLMKTGGPDYWLSHAHGKPMKCSNFMHWDQALRAYIDEINPSLSNMPDNIWSQVTHLMKNTVLKEMRGPKPSDFMFGPGMGSVYRKVKSDLQGSPSKGEPTEVSKTTQPRVDYVARKSKYDNVMSKFKQHEKKFAYNIAYDLKDKYGLDAQSVNGNITINYNGTVQTIGRPRIVDHGEERAISYEEAFSEIFSKIPLEVRRKMSKGSVVVDDPMMETKRS